ncbi:ATP-binding protein, partial [Limnothrix redekei]
TTGTIASFELGQRDLSDRFLIPEKLYGREAEVKTLLKSFERVSQGASELMLVAGFSGIGKTAVVNEVHKPITQQKGYFIKGKFDQFNRNIPLSAFVQAL